MTDRIALVGTGADPDDPDSDGFAMAYRHAAGYQRIDGCELVACADIVRENAEAFADAHDISAKGVYEDYETMLSEVEPDVVSVTVPPAIHADIVVGCAETEIPDAIHCEKPMATSWADCRRMADACDDAGIRLTINHQRRTGPIFREAKSLLDEGAIGDLRRIEWSTKNLFDAGTHLFDLSMFYTDETAVEWVLAGLDYREENRWFGTHNENQAIAQWKYENGVYGLAATGRGSDLIDPYLALSGTDGRIELGASDGAPLRYRSSDTSGWKAVDTDENVWGDPLPSKFRAGLDLAAQRVPGVPDDLFGVDYPSHIDRAIAEVIRAHRTESDSVLDASVALKGTELIFAAYESVRRRGRVDLPLTVDDNPLESMVEEGLVAVGAE
ncbi:glucose-fructose oxidoreductase [Salinigranum rubrum]|uniref:Glucose-fructose oxidoreductase n=1 Tax=Salinigranum rubrum TaxID=755307 RepID=A0A2I8VLG8_9EURY|nr:Gfo/Idh/MocA family oxidoreductase [Salinigranum rubrum]AUV82734.1 glucose-fructose oxidoreductase [Salinigranum rubrum]